MTWIHKKPTAVSAATRAKLSKARLGKHLSAATKLKLKKLPRKKVSTATKMKISKALLGKRQIKRRRPK